MVFRVAHTVAILDRGDEMKQVMRVCLVWVFCWSAHVFAQLPDFTDLVTEVAPSVVNISTRAGQSARAPQYARS